MKKIDSVLKISGAIGKQIVFKQYKDGQVVTKFPDMSGIIASASQRNCRNLFKEAVAFARAINNNPEKKKAYLGKTAKNQSVFNAAISEYMERMKKEER
ncbi:MAG TPA: hypothetical protein VLI68_08895 [Hanamia sp.]|jgi:dimeric dUTPase (all-alpha-NTP-PPase superfamily)|nr:hypothetical protein [Hanamia sp.]